MAENVIEVTDLRCRYGAFEAVRGIDFSVQRGELFALLGTNGAGKTTTLETLEGHRAPSSGSVRVMGLDPMRERLKVRRHTGIMLQESGLVAELTVAETMQFWSDLTSRDANPDAALEKLDLAHRRDVRVGQLSGGERRRLDLATAILGTPDILFLDEPTTGLDPQSRRRTWEIVRDLLAEGVTILLTTHYLEEAEALANRLAIMHEGRIAIAGELDAILAEYPAMIQFDLPDAALRGNLPTLAGEPVASAAARPERVEIRTSELQRDLTAVLAWADAESVALGRLKAQHASLEDVFQRISSGRTETATEENA